MVTGLDAENGQKVNDAFAKAREIERLFEVHQKTAMMSDETMDRIAARVMERMESRLEKMLEHRLIELGFANGSETSSSPAPG